MCEEEFDVREPSFDLVHIVDDEDDEIGGETDPHRSQCKREERIFRRHVCHAKDGRDEGERKKKHGHKGQKTDIVTLFYGDAGLINCFSTFQYGGSAEEPFSETFDLLLLVLIHVEYLTELSDFLLE